MNYYPFHLGDYAAHTGHLEPMEDLAYRRLLDQYYMREVPLPADVQVTAKLVRMRSCIGDVESVLNEFFTLTDEGWRHSRCDEELEKMQDKRTKARASAAASVSARRANVERPLPHVEANVERPLPKSSADVELPTPTPTPIHPHTPKGVRFAEFWDAWPPSPRKVAKAECEKRWKARGLDADADSILANVETLKVGDQWQRGYEPSPLTYLNQRRWEDADEGADLLVGSHANVV